MINFTFIPKQIAQIEHKTKCLKIVVFTCNTSDRDSIISILWQNFNTRSIIADVSMCRSMLSIGFFFDFRN